MKYLIKQHQIAIGDDFSILDENGEKQYFVDGYGFSFGKKLSFQDRNKNELALIKKSLFSFLPKFNIYKNGNLYASVTKKWLSFRPAFIIKKAKTPGHIRLTGRLLDFEYKFTKDRKSIATASKKWFTMSDSYAVDLEGGEDAVLILSAAIIVDLMLHNK